MDVAKTTDRIFDQVGKALFCTFTGMGIGLTWPLSIPLLSMHGKRRIDIEQGREE